MPGDYLAVKVFKRGVVGSAEVVRLLAGWKKTVIGGTFGAVEDESTVATISMQLATEYYAADGTRKLFALAQGTTEGTNFDIFEYDEATDAWAIASGTHDFKANPQNMSGFLHVVGTNGAPYLCVYGVMPASNNYAVAVYDGTSWTRYDTGETGGGAGLLSGALVAHEGLLWWCIQTNNTGTVSFNPVNQASSRILLPSPTPDTYSICLFFKLGKRLFLMRGQNASGEGGIVYELVLGAWTIVEDYTTETLLNYLRGGLGYGADAIFRISDTKNLLIARAHSLTTGTSATGLVAYVIELAAGVLSWTDVTDPVIPAYLRVGSSLGDPTYYTCFGITDTEQDPTTPEFYLYFNSDWDLDGTSWGMFQITDDATEMVLLPTPEIDNSYLPCRKTGYLGGGQTSYYPTGLSISIMETDTDPLGVIIKFRCDGDPLVVPHGSVTAGPFEVGETMTSSSGGSATILYTDGSEVRLGGVTGLFNDTDTITQTTGTNSGANATQNDDSSGRTANRTVKVRYVDSYGVPVTQGTLIAGTISGGSATLNGNDIENVTADPTIEYSVTWDFITDGVPNVTRVNLKLEIVR